MTGSRMTRRTFVGTAAGLGASLLLPRRAAGILRLPGPLREPGSLPDPSLPAGTGAIPPIPHLVVLVMENHSYDSYLGALDRGDGLTFDARGEALNANPDGEGRMIRAFHMPSTCQLDAHPGQNWDASHLSLMASRFGTNDGFVLAS